jgi:hypothetical protein
MKYYTYLEKGKYPRYRGDLFLVTYSRSKKRLIKYLEDMGWDLRCKRGAIVKRRKPAWYPYKRIFGVKKGE